MGHTGRGEDVGNEASAAVSIDHSTRHQSLPVLTVLDRSHVSEQAEYPGCTLPGLLAAAYIEQLGHDSQRGEEVGHHLEHSSQIDQQVMSTI